MVRLVDLSPVLQDHLDLPGTRYFTCGLPHWKMVVDQKNGRALGIGDRVNLEEFHTHLRGAVVVHAECDCETPKDIGSYIVVQDGEMRFLGEGTEQGKAVS